MTISDADQKSQMFGAHVAAADVQRAPEVTLPLHDSPKQSKRGESRNQHFQLPAHSASVQKP
eukprot:9268926-Prorocentrum_lima.AAC.1